MKRLLISHITEYLLSDKRLQKRRSEAERKRQRDNTPHTLEVFIAVDDPASFLLLQALPELQRRYNLSLSFRTVLQKQPDMFPEPQLWDKNIFNDAVRMAELYQLIKPTGYCLDGELTLKASMALVSAEHSEDYLSYATTLLAAAWQNDADKVSSLVNEAMGDANKYLSQLNANETYLFNQGHYLSGTVSYAGEWYWGLERLQYLEERLNELIPCPTQVIKYKKLHYLFQPFLASDEEQDNREQTPLVIYFSIRSPYSYLGLLRAIALCEHYQIPLSLRPVLPMLMRGMKVPKRKGMYIAFDTKREAESYGLDFGKIADPLGKGVERCYALFDYAKSQGKEIEFMKNYAIAVWSKRVFSDTDKGLKKILQRSGLDWESAQPHLANSDWQNWAEDNLKELFSLGLWGVPSFKFKDTSVFGQDKLLFIEHAIRKQK